MWDSNYTNYLVNVNRTESTAGDFLPTKEVKETCFEYIFLYVICAHKFVFLGMLKSENFLVNINEWLNFKSSSNWNWFASNISW